ncbi:transposase [Moritella yayanosii]|uniref:Transposase n=1 Tax=Moritella yayanosii TaxID=69539 RepID=A0A330LPA7_9GAMM|nr:transposase [Moritella yayanosii]SQD78824.1 transposase [Moritella yayanosii]
MIRNENVSPEMIRVAGFEHTASLVKDIPEILALEDTTSLSYKHQVAEDLGKLGKTTDKSRGWRVHSVMLLDSHSTRTLGLIHQDWWCRPDNINDADEKESGKWPDASYFCRQRLGETMANMISVCDREADILSYLQDKQLHNERFVRIPYANIPQKGIKNSKGKRVNRIARTARLTVKVAKITLKAKTAAGSIHVVYAEETNATGKSDALRWVLLTSEPIDTLEQALHIIDIYAARWRIEDFHKAWKTGAGAERQRMTEPKNLERAVSILAFIGIRLLQLREVMTLPLYLRKKGLIDEAVGIENQRCDTVFEQDEWKILQQHYKVRGHDGKTAPDMKWAYKSLLN